MKNPIKRTALVMTMVVLYVGSVGSAFAQSEMPPEEDEMRSMRLERSVQDAGLTEEQRAAMRTLSENHRAAAQPLREQIRAARQTLANTRPGDPNSEQLTAEARRSLESARTALRNEQQQFRSDVQALLTPEQRARVEARQQERRQRMDERRQQRPDGGMRDGRGGRPDAGGMPGGRPRGTGRGGPGGG